MLARKLIGTTVVLFVVLLSSAISAGENTRGDNITQFDLGSVRQVNRSATVDGPRPAFVTPSGPMRRSVGSALSPNAGIGVGVSVDITYDDAQYIAGQGRYIGHSWNGVYGSGAEVGVHFGYRSMTDTLPGYPEAFSGYNVYDAIAGDWPRTQDLGCDLQTADTLGWGGMPSLDVMNNGRVVMAARSHLGNGFLGDGSAFIDNMEFFQVDEFDCAFGPGFNTTFVDSSVYRPNFIDPLDGNYSRFPQVVTQWDGANTVVHLLLIEIALSVRRRTRWQRLRRCRLRRQRRRDHSRGP